MTDQPIQDVDELIEAAKEAARAQGCACDVEVTITVEAPGVYGAHVAHDEWCPLVRARGDQN